MPAFCSSFFGDLSVQGGFALPSPSSACFEGGVHPSFAGGRRFQKFAARPHPTFHGGRDGVSHRYSARSASGNTSPGEYGFSPSTGYALATPPRLMEGCRVPLQTQVYTPASSDCSSVGSVLEHSLGNCTSPSGDGYRGVCSLGTIYTTPTAAYLSPLPSSSAGRMAPPPALKALVPRTVGERTSCPTSPITAPSGPVVGVGVETDQHKIQQREKQIGYGKSTLGYANYLRLVPVEAREPENEDHPVTPCACHQLSKRSWDGQLKTWRRLLHRWDNALPEGEVEEGEDAVNVAYEGDRSGECTPSQSAVLVPTPATRALSPVLSQPTSPSMTSPTTSTSSSVPKQLNFGEEPGSGLPATAAAAAVPKKKVFRSWASECSDTSDYMDLSDFTL